MVVRVDKCGTFGIKPVLLKSVQYLPKLLINMDLIPTIKTGVSFEYLTRHFDFKMTNQKHKSKLVSLIDELMPEIYLKPLHQKFTLQSLCFLETMLVFHCCYDI
jgi:hypothetical protein